MNKSLRLGLCTAALLVAVASLAACNVVGSSSPAASVCGDISSDVGGCTTERHTFLATTCDAIATEWAGALDRAVVAILSGPDSVDGNGRSARLRQQLVIVTSDMNERMRSLNLRDECDVDGVMSVAEPLFSEAVRSGVGTALYDGQPPATYDEWLLDVRKVLRVIDDPG